jgi:glyoxylase-like metal-dependent hydrolase (beta-lactamase superfamily II)
MKSISISVLAAALLTIGGVSAAQGPVGVAPEARPFQLGALKLVALRDAQFVVPNDAKIFGTEVGPDEVGNVLTAAGAPTDKITLSVDALLVEAPGRMILLDTGLGPSAHGILLESLAKAGVAPTAITDVLITHTHGDHVGGVMSAGGGLAFPNATIRMSAKEWAWMQSQTGAATLVKLIASKVKTFEPGEMVAPGITAIAITGHTPGHVGYEVASGSSKLLDIGDTAHSSIISLAKPGWAMSFDSDAAAGKASRAETLARLSSTQELVFAPHFPFPGVGHVEKAGDGFTWAPTLK